MPQLAQGLGFDLPHPLPGHIELLPQLFQRMRPAILQPEAQCDHPLFPRCQAFEHAEQFPPQQLPPGFIHRDACILVLNKIFKVGILFLAHRRFQADGVLRQLQQFPHTVRLHVQLNSDLFRGRLPAIFPQQVTRRLFDPVDALHKVHRDADGPPLIRNGAGDGLTDPPRGIGGKFEAALRLKLFRRLHQTEIAFLNEIQKRQASPCIALCHRHHQPQVRFAELPPGILVPGLRGTGKLRFLLCRQKRHPADLLQIGLYRIVQRHPLCRKLMFQPADLRFIQRRQVRFLFGQVHAAVLQCRIQLVQLRHIVILFVHGTADLLRCQGMVACPRGQCSGQFLRLRQFLHGSCSFPLLLQPEGKAGDHSSTGTFPCFFSRIDWR